MKMWVEEFPPSLTHDPPPLPLLLQVLQHQENFKSPPQLNNSQPALLRRCITLIEPCAGRSGPVQVSAQAPREQSYAGGVRSTVWPRGMSCGWITAASISFPPSLSLFSPLLNLPSTRGEPIPVGQGRAGEPDYAAVPYGCSQTLYFQRWDRKLKPPRKPSTCGITAVRFIKLELSRSSLLC